MEYLSKFLLTLAYLILLGAVGVGAMGFLVILMASFGLGAGLPFYYFQLVDLPVLSVALPVAGMILFATLLLLNSGRHEDEERTTDIEITTNQTESAEKKVKRASA